MTEIKSEDTMIPGGLPHRRLSKTEEQTFFKGKTVGVGNTVYAPPNAKVPEGATGVVRTATHVAYYPPKKG